MPHFNTTGAFETFFIYPIVLNIIVIFKWFQADIARLIVVCEMINLFSAPQFYFTLINHHKTAFFFKPCIDYWNVNIAV